MLDLLVYYFDGTVENVAVQTLGVSYEGGCAASVDFLDLAESDTRGMVLTRTKAPTFDRNGTHTFLEEFVLVPPERMRDAVLVKNGIETLAFRSRDGEMVAPGFAELFGAEEVKEHVANAYAARMGIDSLPDAVREKLERADGGDEDEMPDDDVFDADFS